MLRISVLTRDWSFRRKKTRALLAYLAVTARPHSRSRLCAMFWGLPDDPRAALRWSLTRLRTIIDTPDDQAIIADRENVELNRDGVTVDLLSLRDDTETAWPPSRPRRCARPRRRWRAISSRNSIWRIVESFIAGAPRSAKRRGCFERDSWPPLLTATPLRRLCCTLERDDLGQHCKLVGSRIPGAKYVALESRNHILLPRDPARAVLVSEVRRFLREGARTICS